MKPLRGIVSAGVLALPLATLTPSSAETFSDDFSGGMRPGCWSATMTTNNLYAVDATQGNVHLAKTSAANPGGYQAVSVNLSSSLLGGAITGNFSTQIEFTQAMVPGPGLDQVEFHAFFQDGSIFFTVYDRQGGLNAHVWNGGSSQGAHPVSGDSGTFLISRVGSTVTGYFNGAALASESRASALTGIAFTLQNNNGSNDTTSVRFGGFSLTAASVFPTLGIVAAGRQQLQLQWTANSVGYLLEQSTSLAPAVWEAVTNVPTFANNRFVLIMDSSAPRRFFRLHRQ